MCCEVNSHKQPLSHRWCTATRRKDKWVFFVGLFLCCNPSSFYVSCSLSLTPPPPPPPPLLPCLSLGYAERRNLSSSPLTFAETAGGVSLALANHTGANTLAPASQTGGCRFRMNTIQACCVIKSNMSPVAGAPLTRGHVGSAWGGSSWCEGGKEWQRRVVKYTAQSGCLINSAWNPTRGRMMSQAVMNFLI